MTTINAIAETKEHQELKVPESDLKQWQSKRKSECANQNPAASSSQWQIPEVIPKVDTELTFFSTSSFSLCDDHAKCFLLVLISLVE